MAYTGKDALMAPDGDIAIYQGDLLAISGADAIRQQWLIRVRTWQGEWVLDTEHGVPYRQEIFTKTASPARVEEIFREITLQTPGVLSVESVAFEVVDAQAREVSVEVNATIDGPEGITFQYKGDLPLGASSGLFPANFPNTLSDLRIWLDAQDLDNLTYNSPLTLSNKAGTGEAAGDCILDGVSDLNLKRSALFDRSTEEKLAIADTQAIRHGTGEISMLAVVKRDDTGETEEKEFGILSLDGYDDVNDRAESYSLSVVGDDSTPNSSRIVARSEEISTSKFLSGDSGASNLPTQLTINGQTKDPTFWYEGKDATVDEWVATVGDDLDIAGSGADVTPDAGAPFTDGTESVKFNGGKYHRALDVNFSDLGTDDFVFTAVIKNDGDSTDGLVVKKNGANEGWGLFLGQTNCWFQVEDSVGNSVLASKGMNLDTWYTVEVFFRSGTEMRIYLNGYDVNNVSLSSIGSIDSSVVFSIGSRNGSLVSTDEIAFCSLWQGASWLDTADQADLALELHQRLTGFYPGIADDSVPNTMQRASERYIELYQNGAHRLYKVGPNWAPFSSHQAPNGSIKGYAGEIQSTNLIDYSEDFSGWTKIDAGDTVSNDVEDCPDGRKVAGAMIADSTDGRHGIEKIATITSNTHSFSKYLKPGNKDWAKLEVFSPPSTTHYAYFNVSNGVAGSDSGTVQAVIDGPYLNGFYRCQIIFTGTLASHGHRILSAQSDGDDTFSGDGATVNMYMWGAQIEAGDIATSQIVTSGATATRLKDELQFVAGDNIGGENVSEGMIKFDWWAPNVVFDTNRSIVALSDGGVSTDLAKAETSTSYSNRPIMTTAKTAGNAGLAVSPSDAIPDGETHSSVINWKTNELAISDSWKRGTLESSADMPVGLDRIDIGQSNLGTNQFTGGIISNLEFYPSSRRRVFTPDSLPNFDSQIVQVDIDQDGNVTIYVDGSEVALSSSSLEKLKIRLLNGDGFIAAGMSDDEENTAADYLNGNIGEILVYARNLSDTERDELTEWLKEKWGL